MNATRRRKPPPLAEGSDDTRHYHGHRERLRQRLIEAGAGSLPDYELLEVILFAANPRTDMKPLAKSLLARFGGFAELLSAEPDALTGAGLGLAGIAALKAGREAALRRCIRNYANGQWSIHGISSSITAPRTLRTARSRSFTSCFSTARTR